LVKPLPLKHSHSAAQFDGLRRRLHFRSKNRFTSSRNASKASNRAERRWL